MIDITDKTLNGYKFIDLFCGLGGFRLALESFGAKCVYSNDWDRYVQEVYKENFGECSAGDIRCVDEKTIPDHDILCAGFPCQAFSISGKQRGFEDGRGTLFFDVARIIKEKQPKVVFMENVKNFASHNGGHTLDVVKATMKDLGYTFFYQVLNAVDYGIPQRRERIYMVCFRGDLGINHFSFPKPFQLKSHLEDYLLDENDIPEKLYVKRHDMTLFNYNEDYSDSSVRIGTVNKGGQGERIYSTKGIAITLSAYGGGVFAKTGGYMINGKTRKLHPRECARIMGYPDSYKISDNYNQSYKQFGNSVVIDVLQYIVRELSESLEGAILCND